MLTTVQISTFMETTSHIIRSSLEERALKDGLVDQLRGLICAVPAAEDDHRGEFALSVRGTIGIWGKFVSLSSLHKTCSKMIFRMRCSL